MCMSNSFCFYLTEEDKVNHHASFRGMAFLIANTSKKHAIYKSNMMDYKARFSDKTSICYQ